MPFKRTAKEPIHFDASKIGTVKPTLGAAEGYALSAEDLRNVFGIKAHYFGKLPRRLVVPVLQGRWYKEHWYRVTGHLYVVEPRTWIPKVAHGDTIPASVFKSTYIKEQETITETEFNAGTSAELSIQAGGTFYGVTASVSSSNSISFKYSKSTMTKETLRTQGVSGDEPIHQLFVYPTLKCKVIKQQRIEYTINDSSSELKWSPESYKPGYWDSRWVSDGRLDEIRKLAFNPVPMQGNGLGRKACILPVPHMEGDDLDFTTIISRTDWVDWYIYDAPWHSSNQTITLAVPKNDVAFKPMSTWTTLPPIKS